MLDCFKWVQEVINNDSITKRKVSPEKKEPQETKPQEPETKNSGEVQEQTPQNVPAAPQTIGTASYLAQMNINFVSLNNSDTTNVPEETPTPTVTPNNNSSEVESENASVDSSVSAKGSAGTITAQAKGLKGIVNWFKKNWKAIVKTVLSLLPFGGALSSIVDAGLELTEASDSKI